MDGIKSISEKRVLGRKGHMALVYTESANGEKDIDIIEMDRSTNPEAVPTGRIIETRDVTKLSPSRLIEVSERFLHEARHNSHTDYTDGKCAGIPSRHDHIRDLAAEQGLGCSKLDF